MANYLTDDDIAKLASGLAPVLVWRPDSKSEMDCCVGWAVNEKEAAALLEGVAAKVIDCHEIGRLYFFDVKTVPVRINDAHGEYEDEDGSYLVINAFVPAYDNKPLRLIRREAEDVNI